MQFEKLGDKRKSVHVADQILKAARSGDIKLGDKLPSENKLAEMIGVSRSSVREALAALRLAEIVETRAGDGTYLKTVDGKGNIQERIFTTLTENRRPLHLQEARAAFECGIMKFVVEKMDGQDISQMKKLIAEMREAAEESDYDSFISCHKRFHLAIAKATKNVVIEETIATFKDIMNQRLWRDLERKYYLPRKREYLEESIKIHDRILQALKKGDSELATSRMEKHFERYS